ncbi:hypothetical protein HQ563_01340 [bacterium]|nr:hypothetical protein [bacterium]
MARKFLILMVISFWALMTGLFVKKQYFFRKDARDGARSALLDPEYSMGIYYGPNRIGEFRFNAYPWGDYADEGYRLVSSLHLKYPLVGEAHITGESFTDRELFLRKFSYYLRYKLKMFDEQNARLEGSLQDGKLFLKVKWGTYDKTFEMPAQEGISLYDPITPWIVGGKFRPGREYTVEVFNRLTRTRQLARVKVIRRREIPFEGKEIPGFEVETTVADLKSIFWIGQDGKVYRMESPVGFSLVRESVMQMEEQGL